MARLWEGPRSQWLGGIQSNYDWRRIDPLRPITAAAGSRRSAGGQYEEDEEGNLIKTGGGRRRGAQQGQQQGQAVSPYSNSLTVNDPNNVIGNAWVDQQIAQQPSGTYDQNNQFFSKEEMGEISSHPMAQGVVGRGVVNAAQKFNRGEVNPTVGGVGRAVVGGVARSVIDSRRGGRDPLLDTGPLPPPPPDPFASKQTTSEVTSSPQMSKGSRTSRRNTGTLGV